jgi:hypothetical protein
VRNPDTAPKLRTPGVLAEDLGQPLHRVLYVLRSRQHIRPAAMAGRLRLYDPDALEAIRVELARMDARHRAHRARPPLRCGPSSSDFWIG